MASIEELDQKYLVAVHDAFTAEVCQGGKSV